METAAVTAFQPFHLSVWDKVLVDPGLASLASVAHPWVPGIHLYLFWVLRAGITGEISACMDVGDQISGYRAVHASRLPTEPYSTPAFSLDAPASSST